MECSLRFFRIAVRFLSVARMDLYEVAEALESLGYAIVAPLPPKRFRVSIGGSGPIASKGSVVVDVNSDTMVVGVSAPSPEECVREFIAVERAIRSRIEALRETHFYELLAEIEARIGTDPTELMERALRGSPIVEELSRALGEPLTVFGIRLARAGASPEDSEWIDIEVVPSLARPRTSLSVAIVYRSRDRERVLDVGRSVLRLVEDALQRLAASGRR